ncbi:MAG TPA: hypothetical protein VEB20_09835 [Azospirillaceae bacterium]|nr:hypothetical protein [Azospirillaceae bacterium]
MPVFRKAKSFNAGSARWAAAALMTLALLMLAALSAPPARATAPQPDIARTA